MDTKQLPVIGRGWAKYYCFVNGGQINYSAEANNWSVRHWQITIFWHNRVQKLFYHSVTEYVFFDKFIREVCIFTHVRRKAWLHLHMSRILFAAKHSWTTSLGSRPLFASSYLQVTWWAPRLMKSKKNLHRMIILPFIWSKVAWLCFRFKLIPYII